MVLFDSDKETVRRTIPKPANKILAVAVARLYVTHPNRSKWTYTGISGAAALVNDKIGNTFWIKIVDISPANRGVIWDHEIYDPFYYNQDRTFFHSFELEECLAGLSFVDEKEAKKFKEKMDDREKSADKATKNTPFQALGTMPVAAPQQEKHRGRFSSLLHGSRHSSTPAAQPYPMPVTQPQAAPPSFNAPLSLPTAPLSVAGAPQKEGIAMLDRVHPSWRNMLGELLAMGFTEDQLDENAEFILSYVQQHPGATSSALTTTSDSVATRAAPPPPPTQNTQQSLTPENTGSTSNSRRGPPPAPPPARRGAAPIMQQPSPPRTPSPPRPKFAVPPPFAGAGSMLSAETGPSRPLRNRASSNAGASGPPPPPRPAKVPVEEDESLARRLPPPFVGDRTSNPTAAPTPPLPRRSAAPPPPPRAGNAPPLPPKVPVRDLAPALPPSSSRPVPPPPTQRDPPPPPLPTTARPSQHAPLPPPLPPSSSRPVPPPPSQSGPPPPPPMPSHNGPPPPPLPGRSGPPLPPTAPPPPSLPKASGGDARGGLMDAIRSSGGVGGGGLRKVSEAEKKDRSAAMVPGSEAATQASASAAAGAPAGGMAAALSAALAKRNKKVSASDDEESGEDW